MKSEVFPHQTVAGGLGTPPPDSGGLPPAVDCPWHKFASRSRLPAGREEIVPAGDTPAPLSGSPVQREPGRTEGAADTLPGPRLSPAQTGDVPHRHHCSELWPAGTLESWSAAWSVL